MREDYWQKFQHKLKLRAAVRVIQMGGKFEKRNESTVRPWFKDDGWSLHDAVSETVAAIKEQHELNQLREEGDEAVTAGCTSLSLPRGTSQSFWMGQEELELGFIAILRGLRDHGSIINSLYIQIVLRGFLKAKWPESLAENGGAFTCSRSLVKSWVKSKLGWTFRQATTAASVLPSDHKAKGLQMVLRAAYLNLMHSIHPDFGVIMDQTAVRLQPLGSERHSSVKVHGRSKYRGLKISDK
ncbi:hypothetical protein R1flu_013569 [Riccia fluitans]|uniref:Transposase n=1 Tax=Riccia fluitans TaxID=41844 RepID=A0ABD1YDY1_9MARC